MSHLIPLDALPYSAVTNPCRSRVKRECAAGCGSYSTRAAMEDEMRGWAVAIKQPDGTEVLWGSKDSPPLIWRGRYRKRAEKAAAFVWHSKPWRIVRVEYTEPRMLP